MKGNSRSGHRVFIAIELPDDGRPRFTQLQDELRQKLPEKALRWIKPGNLHLTLHFLGEVASGSLPSLQEALEAGAHGQGSFELRPCTTGCFPGHRRPRVLWAGFEPSPEPENLYRSLGLQLEKRGFETESRPYKPHLTLAYLEKRLTAEVRAHTGTLLRQYDPGPIAGFMVKEVSLVESDLTPSGAVYSTLGTASLGKQGQ